MEVKIYLKDPLLCYYTNISLFNISETRLSSLSYLNKDHVISNIISKYTQRCDGFKLIFKFQMGFLDALKAEGAKLSSNFTSNFLIYDATQELGMWISQYPYKNTIDIAVHSINNFRMEYIYHHGDESEDNLTD